MPSHCRMRVFDRDLIRGGHYGQRSYEPRQKAGHMAAPTNAAKREESPCQPGAVHTWHFSDLTGSPDEVRFLGQSGLPDYQLGLLSLTQTGHRCIARPVLHRDVLLPKVRTSAAKVKRCHPWLESAARLFLVRQFLPVARCFPAGAGWSGPGSNSRIAGSESRSRAAFRR